MVDGGSGARNRSWNRMQICSLFRSRCQLRLTMRDERVRARARSQDRAGGKRSRGGRAVE